MRRIGAVVALAFSVSGCATAPFGGTTFNPDVYTVRSGDTLYSIAWRYQLDPKALARWNDVDEPENLQVGRELRLSPPESGSGSATLSEPTATAPSQEPKAKPARASDPVGASSASGSESAPTGWQWPTKGRLVGTFEDGRVPGSGIDIAGELGQPVKATRAGEVVYSGSGLKAYGRLVIIRHSGDFLSAYAHNDELLVQEGQRVSAGQQIARMGENRDGSAMLHFEIRDAGQPVNPLEHLPKRE